MSKWIPCSEVQPKEGGKYLATYANGTVREAEWLENSGRFSALIEDDLDGLTIIKAVAWMELPEPYKESKE